MTPEIGWISRNSSHFDLVLLAFYLDSPPELELISDYLALYIPHSGSMKTGGTIPQEARSDAGFFLVVSDIAWFTYTQHIQ
jgi:hypothetical protein